MGISPSILLILLVKLASPEYSLLPYILANEKRDENEA